jgi:hypothetical protein
MSKKFLIGFALGLILPTGCASIAYRFYGLNLPESCYEQGTLLGATGQYPNIPFTQCEPDNVVRGKCVIQLEQDFYRKEADLLTCQSDLKKCQNPQ